MRRKEERKKNFARASDAQAGSYRRYWSWLGLTGSDELTKLGYCRVCGAVEHAHANRAGGVPT